MMEHFVLAPECVAFLRLVTASLLGALVGWERETHEKGAGLRTHMLISLGACLFALVVLEMHKQFPGGDVMRVVQGLLLSIGFIAGGVIFTRGTSVTGLTTAAGLWVMTGVGLAIGLGYYVLGLLSTLLTFVIIAVLKRVEKLLHHKPVLTHAADGPAQNSAPER